MSACKVLVCANPVLANLVVRIVANSHRHILTGTMKENNNKSDYVKLDFAVHWMCHEGKQ